MKQKNVIHLKFLRKIKNKNVFPLVNSIRGHTVYRQVFRRARNPGIRTLDTGVREI
jgi:hypothetical protein